MNIEPYTGDPQQWSNWRSRFDFMIGNTPLSNNQKIAYLQGRVTGKVKDAILHFHCNGQFDNDDLQHLERKFERQLSMRSTTHEPQTTNRRSPWIVYQLRNFHQRNDSQPTAIRTHRWPGINNKLALCRQEITSDLIQRQQYIVNRRIDRPNMITFCDWLKLEDNNQQLHTLQTFTTQTSNSKGWTSQSTTSLLGDGRHKIFKCPIFIAQSPEQMTTRNSGLCFNSLNKDHRIANCPSKKNCQHSNCNERHNTLLHRHFQIAGNSSHLTKRQGFRTVNKNQPSEASHNKSQSHRENTTLVHLSQKESTNSCFQRKTDAENYRTETHQPAATLQTSPINLQNQHLQSHEQQLFEDVKSWWKMESYGPRAQEQDNTKWFLPHYRIVSPAKPGKTRRIANAAAVFDGTCLNDHLLDDLVGIILRSREKPILITTDIGISCKLESEKIFVERRLQKTTEGIPPKTHNWRKRLTRLRNRRFTTRSQRQRCELSRCSRNCENRLLHGRLRKIRWINWSTTTTSATETSFRKTLRQPHQVV